jgi:hypothetical protein
VHTIGKRRHDRRVHQPRGNAETVARRLSHEHTVVRGAADEVRQEGGAVAATKERNEQKNENGKETKKKSWRNNQNHIGNQRHSKQSRRRVN